MWRKIRSGLMFVVACVTSPCCTPLMVPPGLALLGGTSAAVLLAANLGWIYGGLTLISIVTLVLGLRWMRQQTDVQRPPAIIHRPAEAGMKRPQETLSK